MREPVPDASAVSFLEKFFYYFADQDKPLFIAFQEAILAMQGSDQHPGIKFLPAVYIGSLTEPPTWRQLGGKAPRRPIPKWVLPSASIGVAALIGSVAFINNDKISKFIQPLPGTPTPTTTISPNLPSSLISDGNQVLITNREQLLEVGHCPGTREERMY